MTKFMQINNINHYPKSQDKFMRIYAIDNNVDNSIDKDANKIFGSLNIHFLRFYGTSVDGMLYFEAKVRHIKKPKPHALSSFRALTKKTTAKTSSTNISISPFMAKRVASRLRANNQPSLILEKALKDINNEK